MLAVNRVDAPRPERVLSRGPLRQRPAKRRAGAGGHGGGAGRPARRGAILRPRRAAPHVPKPLPQLPPRRRRDPGPAPPPPAPRRTRARLGARARSESRVRAQEPLLACRPSHAVVSGLPLCVWGVVGHLAEPAQADWADVGRRTVRVGCGCGSVVGGDGWVGGWGLGVGEGGGGVQTVHCLARESGLAAALPAAARLALLLAALCHDLEHPVLSPSLSLSPPPSLPRSPRPSSLLSFPLSSPRVCLSVLRSIPSGRKRERERGRERE